MSRGPLEAPERDLSPLPYDIRNLFDAATRHYATKVVCKRCGWTVIFDPHALWWFCKCRGVDMALRGLAGRFRCTVCGQRGPKLSLVRANRSNSSLPMPDYREWKRAVSRYRN